MKIFEQHRQYQPLALGLIPALAATVAYFFFSPAMIPTNIDKMIMFGDSLTQVSARYSLAGRIICA